VLVTIDGYDMEEVSKCKVFVVELKTVTANFTYRH
jgi:hypothetical protein